MMKFLNKNIYKKESSGSAKGDPVKFNHLENPEGNEEGENENNKYKKGYGDKPLPVSNRSFLNILDYLAKINRKNSITIVVLIVWSIVTTAYAYYQSTNVKVETLVILKDDIGNLTPLGVLKGERGVKVDEKVVTQQLSHYIENLREVLNNQDLMIRHIREIISMTSPALNNKMKNIMLDQVEKGGLVKVTITQVLPTSGVKNGWKINWYEERSTMGDSDGVRTYWEASVVLDFVPQANNDLNLTLLNPTGMQVIEFNLTKQISKFDSNADTPDPLANQITNNKNNKSVPSLN